MIKKERKRMTGCNTEWAGEEVKEELLPQQPPALPARPQQINVKKVERYLRVADFLTPIGGKKTKQNKTKPTPKK